MKKYFLLDTKVTGIYIYFVEEISDTNTTIDKITHCFYDDFLKVMSMLIKEKEIYTIKIFENSLMDNILISLMNINNKIEIEVIEHI